MGRCKICGDKHKNIPAELEVCLRCIKDNPQEALSHAEKVHERSRRTFGLPLKPPMSKDGIPCRICINECIIGEGEAGYCGIRKNKGGRIFPEWNLGKLSFYYDPLPTNCVGDWVCAGGTGSGYPKYAHMKGPEYGYKNLAVFFHACSFNCLFCQNWHFKKEKGQTDLYTSDELAKFIDQGTSCVCFFGGDPSCQLPFAISFSRYAIENKKGEILRICFETNGSAQEKLLSEAFEISLSSGGCIKFDLKAWDTNLHRVLTGKTNERTFKNFESLAKKVGKRPDPPSLIASTLLIPGYIDEEEIKHIAKFIARLDPSIPYTLLAFYPHFYMHDLPMTAKDLALRCYEVAKKEGLERVKIGNIHLLK